MVGGSDGLSLRFMEPTDYYPMDPPVAAGRRYPENFRAKWVECRRYRRAGGLQQTRNRAGYRCGKHRLAVHPPPRNPPVPTILVWTPLRSPPVRLLESTRVMLQTIADDRFDSTAKFYRFRTHRYYVGLDPNGNTVLYRKADNAAGPGDIIVDGVENMQVMYGEDTNGDQSPDIYRNAGAVATWSNVVAVRIALLVRTENEYGPGEDEQHVRTAGDNQSIRPMIAASGRSPQPLCYFAISNFSNFNRSHQQ